MLQESGVLTATSLLYQRLQVSLVSVGWDSSKLLWEGNLGKDALWATRWETTLLQCPVSFFLFIYSINIC